MQKNFLEHPVIIVKKCGVQKILLAKKQEFYVVVSGLWHTCFTPISNTYKFQEKKVWDYVGNLLEKNSCEPYLFCEDAISREKTNY